MEEKDTRQRLSKVLAQAGVDSRRHCEELIFEGKVRVNGKIVLLPQTMVGPEDEITLNKKRIQAQEKKVYYILNKPKGAVCSTEKKYKQRVLDLFKDSPYRLFTVGRLDKDTTGLMLITNDGNFANKVIHPSSDVEKEYIAILNKPIFGRSLKAIEKGTLVEGVFVKPLVVQAIGERKIRIVVKEGKKREVRLLIEAAEGFNAVELERTRIGKLKLGRLLPGSWRSMTDKDKQLIFEREIDERKEKKSKA